MDIVVCVWWNWIELNIYEKSIHEHKIKERMLLFVGILVAINFRAGFTYRSQFANIPTEVFSDGHHLVYYCIQFGGVEYTISISVVQTKHDWKIKEENVLENWFDVTVNVKESL